METAFCGPSFKQIQLLPWNRGGMFVFQLRHLNIQMLVFPEKGHVHVWFVCDKEGFVHADYGFFFPHKIFFTCYIAYQTCCVDCNPLIQEEIYRPGAIASSQYKVHRVISL